MSQCRRAVLRVQQTVILLPSLSLFVASYQTHTVRSEAVRPIERRAGDIGARKIQDRPLAAATQRALVKKPLRIR